MTNWMDDYNWMDELCVKQIQQSSCIGLVSRQENWL